jgi:hypothetical protein
MWAVDILVRTSAKRPLAIFATWITQVKSPESHESLLVTKEHPFYTMLVLKDLLRHHFDVEDSWGEITLPWLLVNTHYPGLTKTHDAVYSILEIYGLFGTLAGLPYPLIDYSRAVEDVYTEWTSSTDWAKSH